MREAFVALNDLVIARLTERGHADVRPAHGAVFQYLDDTGTTVSVLAERAQMTKQAMAELVRHLETHGYLDADPRPGRPARQARAADRRKGTRSSPSPRNWSPSWRTGSSRSSAPIGSARCVPTWTPFAGWPATSS